MKLLYRILIRLSIGIILILTGWGICFYIAIMDEINDEVDDSLEDYSELIIIRSLAGEDLPSKSSGSNNQYFLTEIDKEYADRHEDICYQDSMIYIPEKGETEPARILTTLFKNEDEKYYKLTVYTPTIEKEDLRSAILHLIIYLYIALLLTIILINIWVFRKSMKPLYVLLHWLDNYRLGNKNTPLQNQTNVTEFRKLNEAAIRYATRSEKMFEQQKQFIGNASHEMQTPLAICQNRIEMLMEDESLSENQMEELLKTHQTLDHVTKLNKSLLLLSKIENSQFSDIKEVKLNSVLKQYLDDYKEVYAYRNITLTMDEKGSFLVEMNESLATVLITNLLKNAYVHNIENGHIHILLTTNRIIFRNSSEQTALDENRIFERFYQGCKKEGSTGLGLAIAHSICKQYGLLLSYTYQNNEHCFCIEKSK